ncbi:MAG: clostripain-related cysteine peptidase [Bacillota bacterium]|nr:clostripain-related cysteine peptidase [Bacillota bacterium]
MVKQTTGIKKRLLFRHMCRIMALILVALITLPLNHISSAQGKRFTLLVYMTGSDLETRGQAASADILEMAKALPQSGSVRVLVQAGGASQWELDIDPEKSTRIEIRDGGWHKEEEEGSKNMGEALTLKEFLHWGYSYAPADEYGLILWNHGAGPLLGVCFDEVYADQNRGMDSLSMKELEEALRDSPFQSHQLAFIGFDACLMSTLEVAALAAPYAQYMIASQETEVASGWDYAFLKDASAEENGEAWGNRIIQAYADSLSGSLATATLSCLDLSQMDRVLLEMEQSFSDVELPVTTDNYPALARCRANTKTLGENTTSRFDLIDLIDLISMYENNGLTNCENLRSALNDMILTNYVQNGEYMNGLSIYYPFDNKGQYIASWASQYQKSSFSPSYRSFIQRITDLYLKDALLSHTSQYLMDLQEETGRIRIKMPITEEEAKMLVRSRLLVLEKVASDSYKLVYYDDQKVKVTDREVSVNYMGNALYLIDHKSGAIKGPISYFPIENGVTLYGLVYKGWEPMAANLVYQRDSEGRFNLTQVMTAHGGENQIFLPAAVDLADYDEVQLVSFGPQNVVSEETVTSLQFSLYFPEETVLFDPKNKDLELSFLEAWDRYERYAYLRLTDIQGETHFSNVKAIPSPHLRVADPQTASLAEGLSVQLEDGFFVTGIDAGLMLNMRVDNQRQSDVILQATRAFPNDFPLEPTQFDTFRYLIPSGEEKNNQISLFIPLETLQSLQLSDELKKVAITFSIQDGEGPLAEETIDFSLSMNMTMLRKENTP